MNYIMDLRRLVGHRELIMPAACLIVGDGRGNVLLQRRADDGKWANHGGAVEPGERVEDALIREVREELGVTPVAPRLLGVYSGPGFRHTYPNGDKVYIIDITYYCQSVEGVLELQPEEVTEVRWFPLTALPENLLEHNRAALEDYRVLCESAGEGSADPA